VNEKCRIMLTSNEPSSSDNQGEALKPSTRGLLEAIKRTTETTGMTIRNRVAMRWVHAGLLMQLNVKKSILHVKLRDDPPMNRGRHNKSMNGGPVSNRSKCLFIVTIILLLKTMGNKTCFIALYRAIKAGLDLIDPLAHDQNNRRVRDKIQVSVCSRATISSAIANCHSG
jgi:hypothetical protein